MLARVGDGFARCASCVAGKNALLTRDYAILHGPPARYGNILVYTFIPLLKLPISTALFGSDSVRALGTDIPGTVGDVWVSAVRDVCARVDAVCDRG